MNFTKKRLNWSLTLDFWANVTSRRRRFWTCWAKLCLFRDICKQTRFITVIWSRKTSFWPKISALRSGTTDYCTLTKIPTSKRSFWMIELFFSPQFWSLSSKTNFKPLRTIILSLMFGLWGSLFWKFVCWTRSCMKNFTIYETIR